MRPKRGRLSMMGARSISSFPNNGSSRVEHVLLWLRLANNNQQNQCGPVGDLDRTIRATGLPTLWGRAHLQTCCITRAALLLLPLGFYPILMDTPSGQVASAMHRSKPLQTLDKQRARFVQLSFARQHSRCPGAGTPGKRGSGIIDCDAQRQ